MTKLQYFTVYNMTTGQVYIVKGKRTAERIVGTANKLSSLINVIEHYICEPSLEFFKKHHIDKSKIHFCWDATPIQKMDLLRNLFKTKDLYAR